MDVNNGNYGLTEEQIMLMSPLSAEEYAASHPWEAAKIASVFAWSSMRHAKKVAKHALDDRTARL